MNISIIIIVKNDRRIQNLLPALIPFIQKNIVEVIVIDSSQGLLDDIKNKFLSVHWINYENKTHKNNTIPEQRNKGVVTAKGKIIIFIDSDCVPENDWLNEIIYPIIHEKEDIVAGKVLFSHVNSNHSLAMQKHEAKKYLDEAPTMNLALRASVFKKVGLFDTNFSCGEDVDLLWRAGNMGYKIRSNNNAIIYHDQGDTRNEIRRMYVYGRARTKLYRKNTYRLKYFMGNELLTILYPLYFLFLPLTYFFLFYPLLLMIPILRNKKNISIKVILFRTIYGLGVIKEIIFPSF